MPITFSCTACQASLRLRDEHSGKKIRCPKCKEVIQVPPSLGADAIIETESVPDFEQQIAAAPQVGQQLVAPPQWPAHQAPVATRPCPECGQQIPIQARDCPACGADVLAADADDEEEPQRRKRKSKGKFKPCPKCGGGNTKRVKYTFWGSFYGPQLFNHVCCQNCGYCYNGKTGRSNLLVAIIFVTVPLILIIAIIVFMFFLVSSRLTPH